MTIPKTEMHELVAEAPKNLLSIIFGLDRTSKTSMASSQSSNKISLPFVKKALQFSSIGPVSNSISIAFFSIKSMVSFKVSLEMGLLTEIFLSFFLRRIASERIRQQDELKRLESAGAGKKEMDQATERHEQRMAEAKDAHLLELDHQIRKLTSAAPEAAGAVVVAQTWKCT